MHLIVLKEFVAIELIHLGIHTSLWLLFLWPDGIRSQINGFAAIFPNFAPFAFDGYLAVHTWRFIGTCASSSQPCVLTILVTNGKRPAFLDLVIAGLTRLGLPLLHTALKFIIICLSSRLWIFPAIGNSIDLDFLISLEDIECQCSVAEIFRWLAKSPDMRPKLAEARYLFTLLGRETALSNPPKPLRQPKR
jgi:hypothetical protein